MRFTNKGFSLVELVVAMTIFSVLTAMGVPRFQSLIEQNRLDLTSATLQSLWTGEKIYWSSHHIFGKKADLVDEGLLDSALSTKLDVNYGGFKFRWEIASDKLFKIYADRTGSVVWTGSVWIDQDGALGGDIKGTSGSALTPK